jgi:beta-mannosidase
VLSVDFVSPVEGAKAINAKMESSIPPKCPPPMYNGECHMNLLRKMQASFGWDWGLAAPSMGIWKNVQIEVYESIMIRDITFHLSEVNFRGSYPDLWTLSIFVHMESGVDEFEFEGVLTSELM